MRGTNWHNTGLYPDMVYNVMIDPHNTSTLYAGTMGDGFYISYRSRRELGGQQYGLQGRQRYWACCRLDHRDTPATNGVLTGYWRGCDLREYLRGWDL